jgi:hypothetical protein
MVDFQNFISAARILLAGDIPYGRVEFFAPLWTSVLVFPFVLIPGPFNMYLWQFASIVAIIVTCIMTIPRSRLFPLLIIFSPPSLLLVVVGQLSAFVALTLTGLLLEAANKRRTWILLICSCVALSKPHLAVFPIAMMLFALIQKKEYRKVIYIAGFFIGLFLLFELLFPTSTFQWLKAIFSGRYETGDENSLQHVLLSNGTMISIGIGYFRGSILFFIPISIVYGYYYLKESLTPRVIALTLSIMFLILPYYRLYDFVMLIYPFGILYERIIHEFEPAIGIKKKN